MLAVPQIIYKEVEEVPVDICKAVEEVSARVKTLEPRRRYLFMEWLSAHCSVIQIGNITEGLESWYGSMPQQNVPGEHDLILREIDWWQAQSEATLERLMREHFAGRRS